MRNWIFKIDLSKEFEAYYDDELTYNQFNASTTLALFAALDEIKEKGLLDEDALMKFEDHIEYLSVAEDEEEWDSEWQSFYDFCDDNRIWIGTV